MTSVLTVPPWLAGATFLSEPVMGRICKGYARTGGRVQVAVPTRVNLSRAVIPEGREALDRAVRATKGDIVVLAHSQGAQICGAWLRRYGNDPTAPAPDRLRFILTGNPERGPSHGAKGGGTSLVDGGPLPDTPANTRYTVWDVAKRGDKYASPNGSKSAGAIHTFGYFTVDLDHLPDPVEIVGNTRYFVVP